MKGAGLATLGALLGACTPKAPEPTAKPAATVAAAPTAVPKPVAPTAAPKGPVTLRWGTYTFEAYVVRQKQLFENYKKLHPEVTVELIVAPWNEYWTKIEAQAAAGDPINVSKCEPQFSIPWGKRGLMLDIKPLVDTVDPKTFVGPDVMCADLINTTTFFQGCKSGGNTMWSFPGNGSAFVVYLNMKLLKEAGLEYPKEDWTWDDFKKYAIALTKDAKGKHPGESGFDKDNRVQYGTCHLFGLGDEKCLKSFIWHAGGRRWSDDYTKCMYSEPKAQEALTFMQDLGVTTGTSPIPGGFEGIAQPFLTGKIGMHVQGGWNVDPWATDLTDWEFDIQRLPIGPAGPDFRYSHTGWSNSVCMFKGAKNQDEAWELYKYALMTKEGSQLCTNTPTVKAAVEDKAWMDYPAGKHIPKHREILLTCLAKEAGINQLEPAGLPSADMINVVANELPKLALGRAKPKEWADTVCAGIQAVWAKAKS